MYGVIFCFCNWHKFKDVFRQRHVTYRPCWFLTGSFWNPKDASTWDTAAHFACVMTTNWNCIALWGSSGTLGIRIVSLQQRQALLLRRREWNYSLVSELKLLPSSCCCYYYFEIRELKKENYSYRWIDAQTIYWLFYNPIEKMQTQTVVLGFSHTMPWWTCAHESSCSPWVIKTSPHVLAPVVTCRLWITSKHSFEECHQILHIKTQRDTGSSVLQTTLFRNWSAVYSFSSIALVFGESIVWWCRSKRRTTTSTWHMEWVANKFLLLSYCAQ